jgi:hypothetical protein
VLTAAQLIAQAAQDAHAPNYVTQGLTKLNIILDEICLVEDFALARGVYYFPLNPGLTTTIGGYTNFSGPYSLPLDYLRASASTGEDGRQTGFFYVFDGVIYPMVPIDLGKFDTLVQQPGQQNFPGWYATDVSTENTAQNRIMGTTTAQLTIGQFSANVAQPAGIVNGMGVAGQGIGAGAIVTNVAGNVITLSQPNTGTYANALGVGAASIYFGWAPNAYIWPGPSGAFPATLRYQRLMPSIQDTGQIPWFPDQNYLLNRLSADLMSTTDDARRDGFLRESERILGKYRSRADDKTNRSQVVQLDRQVFGTRWRNLRNTKTIGW